MNINGAPALRVGDVGIHMACCTTNTWKATQGSTQVIVNGVPLVRKGDSTQHCGGPGKMINASTNVFDGSAATQLLRAIEKWLTLTSANDIDFLLQQQTLLDIAAREEKLQKAGIDFDDTDVYNALDAIGTVLANKGIIEKMSLRYNISPALLAGVVASEMDFDFSEKDYYQDGIARHSGILVGKDPGIANVNRDTLVTAAVYLWNHHLQGGQDAFLYIYAHPNPASSASLHNSVEEAAIATAMYSHVHGGAKSAEDMAVIWGGYRTGVDGVSSGKGGYTKSGFKQNVARGTDSLLGEFKIGKNAYMSQPVFEYFQNRFK